MKDTGEIFFHILQTFQNHFQIFVKIAQFLIFHFMRHEHAFFAQPCGNFAEVFAIQGIGFGAAEAFKSAKGFFNKFFAFTCKGCFQTLGDGVVIFITRHMQRQAFQNLAHVVFLFQQVVAAFHKSVAVRKEQRPVNFFYFNAFFFIFAQGNLIADQCGIEIPLGEVAVNGFIDG